MDNIIGADAAKLAGLQIDLLQKLRSKQVTVAQLEQFLNLTRAERSLSLHELALRAKKKGVISIDRTKPFNTAGFFINQPAEVEEHGVTPDVVDLTKIRLVHMLKPGERYIKGYKMMDRLKNFGSVLLDFGVFLTLYENQRLIPESWKQGGDRDLSIFFNGTIIRCADGHRHIFGLAFITNTGSSWCWTECRLDGKFSANDLSAVLSF